MEDQNGRALSGDGQITTALTPQVTAPVTAPGPAEQAPLGASAPPARRQLNIHFTGTGSEYFRIWVVNLLLIVVTAGLYMPFAKARRIRYFYANTLVDGHALAFHGDAWKMFRGFALLVALMGTYSVAGRFSPLVALLAFVVLCAVWPALWRASMQFRLAHTSWRGLRMSFDGSLKNAYLAVAPLYLPLIVFIGTSLFLPLGDAAPATSFNAAAAPDPSSGAVWLLLALFGVVLALPWFMALSKRYCYVSDEVDGIYKLFMKGGLLALVAVLVAGACLAAIVFALRSFSGPDPDNFKLWLAPVVAAASLAFYLLWFAIVAPYFATRLQNMVWGGTRSESLVFDSRLRFRALLWLTLKIGPWWR